MRFVIQGFWLFLAFILILTSGKYLSEVLKNISKKFSYAVFGLSRILIMFFHSIWLSSCLNNSICSSPYKRLQKNCFLSSGLLFSYVLSAKTIGKWYVVSVFIITDLCWMPLITVFCNNAIYSFDCVFCYARWSNYSIILYHMVSYYIGTCYLRSVELSY